MELCTVEGVRAMFYEYASRQAQTVAALSARVAPHLADSLDSPHPAYTQVSS